MTMIEPGDKVYLRACLAGEPGTVIREERGKLNEAARIAGTDRRKG